MQSSAATASRSEAVAESKDPYPLNFPGAPQGILPVLVVTADFAIPNCPQPKAASMGTHIVILAPVPRRRAGL